MGGGRDRGKSRGTLNPSSVSASSTATVGSVRVVRGGASHGPALHRKRWIVVVPPLTSDSSQPNHNQPPLYKRGRGRRQPPNPNAHASSKPQYALKRKRKDIDRVVLALCSALTICSVGLVVLSLRCMKSKLRCEYLYPNLSHQHCPNRYFYTHIQIGAPGNTFHNQGPIYKSVQYYQVDIQETNPFSFSYSYLKSEMSAHGEETEANKLRAAQSCVNSPEDSDEPWDPPMDDDTVFEAGTPISSDTDLEWDPPSHDDTVLGKFEDMIKWGDEQVDENQFHKAVNLYESARRTLANDEHERLEKDQLVHSKLSRLYLRCGDTDRADLHMTKASPACKEDLSVKLALVKDHLIQGGEARKNDDWIAALKEVEAMIAAGADSSQPILAFRAEMLLRQDRLAQAKEVIGRAIALPSNQTTMSEFLNMPPKAYLWAVKAQIEMALGRFKSAIAAADKAHRIDEFVDEISSILTRTACDTGDQHYGSGDYLRAREVYKVGLAYAKSNVTLLYNLAACHWQLQAWELCIEICHQVLQIQPDDGKALFLRADSYAKLEKWDESVKCYETAIKICPENAQLVLGLRESQAALKESQVAGVSED